MSTNRKRPLDASAGDDSSLRDTAARWVVRRDRGLSAVEQNEFEAWLRADPRHESALKRSSAVWARFEAPGAQPAVKVIPPKPRSEPTWLRWGGMAAAIAMAGLIYLQLRPGDSPEAEVAQVQTSPADVPQTRVLADGTLARLNAGAIVVEDYSAAERTVQLLQGEAYFAVTKDLARPFVVVADGVRIRAVGTAFGVSLLDKEIDVLVTEGTVEVAAAVPAVASSASEPAPAAPLVTAGHRAVVARGTAAERSPVVVSEVDIVEVNRANSWRGGLLRLGGATLAELVREFEQQTGRKVVLADPTLETMRVGGRFPGDDVDGFVRVLEQHYGVRARREADGTLTLDRAP